MKQADKQAWIDALRSGEYIQAQGRLGRIENGVTKLCCLGVFCSVNDMLPNSRFVHGDRKLLHFDHELWVLPPWLAAKHDLEADPTIPILDGRAIHPDY